MQTEHAKPLVECAMRRAAGDAVIRGGTIFNVFTGETEERDIVIKNGVIAAIGTGYRAAREYDASGKILLPSFFDAHLHVESSMLTPEAFACLAVAHGTGCIVADPHELVNVCGVEGAEYVGEAFARLRAGEICPLDVLLQLPSCVPATPFETSGACLDARSTAEELSGEDFFGLGEMMNYVGVTAGDAEVLANLDAAFRLGKPADGHAPGLRADALNAYLAAGVLTDHESLSAEEIAEKLARGMYVQVRCGSSADNAAVCAPLMTAENHTRFLLCSDDKHAADLVQKGHIDAALARLVACGVPPLWAVRSATLNVAQCYRLRGRGALAPGYAADVVAVDDLASFRVRAVFKGGVLVAEEGRALFGTSPYLPQAVRDTVHVGNVTADSFRICIKKQARALFVVPNTLVTEEVRVAMKSRGGDVVLPKDVCKLAVVERHFASGNIGLGFLKGYGFCGGAMGISVAHDSHNLVVLGDDNAAMARVVALLKESGGGMALVASDGAEEVFPLDVAGLMSSAPAEEVARRTAHIAARARRMGVKEGYDPFMTLAFLALPVIPHIKLTDRGLFDADAFCFVPTEAEA